MPQPRPALRRAPDAEVHPALVVLPDAGSASIVLPEPESSRVKKPQEKKRKGKKNRDSSSKKGKSQKHKKQAKEKLAADISQMSDEVAGSRAETVASPISADNAGKFRGAGRATSDVLIQSQTKKSTRKVRISVDLYDDLRGAAAAAGADVDELMNEIIAAWLAEPERW